MQRMKGKKISSGKAFFFLFSWAVVLLGSLTNSVYSLHSIPPTWRIINSFNRSERDAFIVLELVMDLTPLLCKSDKMD